MKHIKILNSSILTGLLLLQTVSPVMAADSNFHSMSLGSNPGSNTGGITHEMNRIDNIASRAGNIKEQTLPQIISRADILITNRLHSLQELLTRVTNDKNLTDEEKTSLTNDIQGQISGLQNLKTKIDADTDIQTALSDTKQIYTSYYVYAVFEPKMRLLLILNNLQLMLAKLQTIVPQLQNLVTTYGQGQDTTHIQSLITDINTQLTSMNTTVSADITKVEAISISSSTSAKTTFDQVRQDISSGFRTNLQKIRSDIEELRPLLKQLIGTSGIKSGTTSAELNLLHGQPISTRDQIHHTSGTPSAEHQ